MAINSGNNDYLLSRDFVDCARLNLQHYLWRELFGYLIHPAIPTSKENLRIADVGTGTARWLLDIAPQLHPSTQLEGFDIDLTQAPPVEWLPQNLHLRKVDIFEDLPQELIGQYDVVHIQLFIFIVDEDPAPLLRTLIKMLKPGGSLQWGEPDLETMYFCKANPSKSSRAVEDLFRITEGLDHRLRATWVKSLPELLEQEGLMHVRAEYCLPNDTVEYAMHECNLLIYDMIIQAKGQSETAEKISKLIPAAGAETKNGVMIRFKRLNVIGMKPVA